MTCSIALRGSKSGNGPLSFLKRVEGLSRFGREELRFFYRYYVYIYVYMDKLGIRGRHKMPGQLWFILIHEKHYHSVQPKPRKGTWLLLVFHPSLTKMDQVRSNFDRIFSVHEMSGPAFFF